MFHVSRGAVQRHSSATSIGGTSQAIRPLVELLESRQLLSVVVDEQAGMAIQGMTREELAAEQHLALISGDEQTSYAVPGEWIVSLKRNAAIFSPDGELVDLNIEWAGPTTPVAPELLAYLDKSGLGLEFEQYLGTKDAFLISAPVDLTYQQIEAALKGLDQFETVEPNGVVWAAAANDQVGTGERPGELRVIGDVGTGNPSNDTIVVRYASDPNFIEAIVNGIVQARVATSGVTSITVYGLGGNDNIDCSSLAIGANIYGGDGNDTVAGGSGADLIYGGNGDDSLAGNDGVDTIYGNFGADILMGGLQGDDLKGGLGKDTLTGGAGNDRLYGGAGTDSIHSGAGDDYVEGKGQSDTIYGGSGNDTISAGTGDDWIYVHDAGPLSFPDSVDGGEGIDSAQWDASDTLLGVERQLGWRLA